MDRGLVGTKEGCATGDCGACTTAVYSLEGGRLACSSLNACITPLASLAGKLLVTAEGLAEPDGTLHPVQQAMVEEHGSQCGFCTPGFVMSLYSHLKNGAAAEREAVITSISGNLCRCTGYVPIIRAGMRLRPADAEDWYANNAAAIKKRLAALQRENRPRRLAELEAAWRKKPKARPVAGSTDLGLELTQQLAEHELLPLAEIPELRGIKKAKTRWSIGAAATWAEVEELIAPELPGMSELLHRFGSPPIRAQATVGGNIANASPVADGPPVFLALGCTLVLQRDGKKREVALEDFYQGYKKTVLRPRELIREVRLRRPAKGEVFDVGKISKRFEDDISAVCGAWQLRLGARNRILAARVAYGGMAAVPLRAKRCEAALTGQPFTLATVAAAAAALSKDYKPLDDMRASAAYRMTVARNLLRRFYLRASGQDAGLEQLSA
ncbi:MAG: xanthine dehydrogenase small subunit [Betaproteobacteria bacterium AqS2]|uniref:Xanthine dehydrogenase small subunit n=1 Tax=Candidatus Amphirhobacter heronislandensis TaxID=1732024 RepID=A0A930XWA1_9GAMM|nr:xanthine dehydrogenase small subunit [Betaproteobacteria bacterium AqS2]